MLPGHATPCELCLVGDRAASQIADWATLQKPTVLYIHTKHK
jgi:hypothetical protein